MHLVSGKFFYFPWPLLVSINDVILGLLTYLCKGWCQWHWNRLF